MMELYRKPEEKRLPTAANFHAWTVGTLVNGMEKAVLRNLLPE